MFTLELKDATREITVETDTQLDMLAERARAFAAAVEVLHAAIPLASFLGQRTVGNPLLYTYSFVTRDGRVWNQTINFQNGVSMTFSVPDGWRLEEFVPHRAVRDAFVLLVRDFGLEKAEVVYA